MRFLIVFGSTEGHTGEICEFAARVLRDLGHAVTVAEAKSEGPEVRIGAYDAVLLAGSLHLGRFKPVLVRFARAHAAELSRKPNALISVSLSAAGENADDWAGLGRCVRRFEQETSWTPRALLHAAGAIRYSRYSLFKRFAIKAIAARRGLETVTSRDYDLTDYEQVRAFILQLADAAAAQATRT